jgi:hypothetical protein
MEDMPCDCKTECLERYMKFSLGPALQGAYEHFVRQIFRVRPAGMAKKGDQAQTQALIQMFSPRRVWIEKP